MKHLWVPASQNCATHSQIVPNLLLIHKGVKGKHGIQYTLYVVHRVRVALNQLHQHYKDRFGIETSYRIKNGCRIRTTSKNPVVRFLFVALAFILVNLWVYLLWVFVSQTQRGGRVVYRELFSLYQTSIIFTENDD